MRTVATLAFVLLYLSLSGCASLGGGQTAAYYTAIDISVSLKESDRKAAECNRQFEAQHSTELGQIDSLIVSSAVDPKKYDKLLNRAKLTSGEKKLALSLWNKYPCRGRWLVDMSKIARPQSIVWSMYFTSLDSIRIQLLRDDINIGQFNQAKLNLQNERDKDLSKAKADLDASLNKAHYDELNARAQRAQAAAATMNAINSSTIQTPSFRSTTCNMVNDQIHCLSF